MRVVVGRIGKPHGIRGEVTVEPRTDEPDVRFVAGAELMRHNGGLLLIELVHWHSGRLLVKFLGCDTRNDAEELRGTLLEVERDPEELPQGDDEFYDSQLIGCKAVTLDGDPIGEVKDVLHLPLQDVLVVVAGDEEYLIPFVSEIVPEVDLETGLVKVNPPPGLLSELVDE